MVNQIQLQRYKFRNPTRGNNSLPPLVLQSLCNIYSKSLSNNLLLAKQKCGLQSPYPSVKIQIMVWSWEKDYNNEHNPFVYSLSIHILFTQLRTITSTITITSQANKNNSIFLGEKSYQDLKSQCILKALTFPLYFYNILHISIP